MIGSLIFLLTLEITQAAKSPQDIPCPQKNTQEWQEWLTNSVNVLIRKGAPYWEVVNTLKSCEREFAKRGLAACMEPLKNYLFPRDAYRENIELYKKYLNSRPAAYKRPPHELRNLGSSKVLHMVVVPQVAEREVTLIEQPDADYWILRSWNPEQGGDPRGSGWIPTKQRKLILVRTESVIVVEKNAGKSKIHFVEHLHPNVVPQNCFDCHDTGLKSLVPFPGGISSKDKPILDYMNEKIREYSVPAWDGFIHPEDHGPAAGRAQNCTSCHNGRKAEPLRLSQTHSGSVTTQLTRDFSMPMDHAQRDLQPLLAQLQTLGDSTEQERKVFLDEQKFSVKGLESYLSAINFLEKKGKMEMRDAAVARQKLTTFGEKNRRIAKEYFETHADDLIPWLLKIPCQEAGPPQGNEKTVPVAGAK